MAFVGQSFCVGLSENPWLWLSASPRMYELMGNLSLPLPLTALTSIDLGGRAACIEEAGFRSKKEVLRPRLQKGV